MRHAHARDNAGGANAAGAYADLYTVSARLHQCQSSGAGGDIAAYDVDVRIVLFDPAHTVNHAFAVAVGGIDNYCVYTGLDQCFYALFSALAHADCCTYAQLATRIAGGVGESGLLGDVLDGNQTLEFKIIVDQQHPFKPVLVQQCLGIIE